MLHSAAVFTKWATSTVRTYRSNTTWITDSYDPLPTMAADLVQHRVAVIPHDTY
jgi:hypothetical protein